MSKNSVYVQTYNNLYLICLTPEQHSKTCNYWYTIEDYCSPHTAFTTREALFSWLEARGLEIDLDAMPQRGKHAFIKIKGAYRTAGHYGSYDGFFSLRGQRIKVLSNGELTMGIVTHDTDGFRTVHHLNPNMRDRPVYPYHEYVK